MRQKRAAPKVNGDLRLRTKNTRQHSLPERSANMTQTNNQIEDANAVIFENQQSNLDVIEDTIFRFDKSVLRLLLKDKTTQKNIIWATSDYESLGSGYEEYSEILPEFITGEHTLLIQPRSSKKKKPRKNGQE